MTKREYKYHYNKHSKRLLNKVIRNGKIRREKRLQYLKQQKQ